MRPITLAATQMACSTDRDRNISQADSLVREAASRGAQIILLQELFETLYFCQVEDAQFFRLASTLEENRAVSHFRALARELEVVLPISFFERRNQAHYNSVAVIARPQASTLTTSFCRANQFCVSRKPANQPAKPPMKNIQIDVQPARESG